MRPRKAFSVAYRFRSLPFVFLFCQSAQTQQVCAPPTTLERPNAFFKAMAAWWPATGSATCIQAGCSGFNDIIGGYNGTPIGGLTFTAGEVGQAFNFNGQSALELGSAGTIGKADFTFDFWLLSNTSSITQGVLGKRPACGPGNFYDFRTLSAADFGGAYVGHLLVEVDGGSDADDNEVISSKVITDGVFHHVAIVRQATTVMVYIDGVLDSSGTGSDVADVTNSSVLTAGESACNGSNANAPLVGELDEIHLYNRALAASEIQAIYNAGSAGVCPQARFARPTLMGVSVGNTTGTASACNKTTPCASGTAGLLVYSTSNPSQQFILGSNHVLSAVGPTFCPGTALPGTWTLQPGTGDLGIDPGNIPHYHVASFTTGVTNSNIDAGLSQIVGPTDATTGIFGIGEPNPHVGVAYSGENVVKSGEATGVTMGTVKSVNVTVPIPNTRCLSLSVFHNQISITPQGVGPFSAGGDSGSAILDVISMTPIGLLMAGTSTVTFANPINTIYVDLSVFPVSPSGAGLTWEQELGVVAQSGDPRLARLEEIQERHEDEVLRIPGVQAIGIGLDEKSENLLFHVYVIKRTPSLTGALPREIDGIPVQVIETGGEVTPL